MDGKFISSTETKPGTTHFSTRVGLWVVVVCVISATFLISNYLVVNERIAVMEGKLESLQRGENLNQDVSSDEQTGGKDEHHVRRKRALKRRTQASAIADFEKTTSSFGEKVSLPNTLFCLLKNHLAIVSLV